MNPGRGTTCAVCGLGLVACVCLVASEVVESVHHPLGEGRPSVVATAPPKTPSADHTHEDRVGFVTLGADRLGITATSSEAPPPGTFVLDTAAQVARRNFGRYYHPASLIFFPPPDHSHEEPGSFVNLRENQPVGGTDGGIVVTPGTATVQFRTASPTIAISDPRLA